MGCELICCHLKKIISSKIRDLCSMSDDVISFDAIYCNVILVRYCDDICYDIILWCHDVLLCHVFWYYSCGVMPDDVIMISLLCHTLFCPNVLSCHVKSYDILICYISLSDGQCISKFQDLRKVCRHQWQQLWQTTDKSWLLT